MSRQITEEKEMCILTLIFVYRASIILVINKHTYKMQSAALSKHFPDILTKLVLCLVNNSLHAYSIMFFWGALYNHEKDSFPYLLSWTAPRAISGMVLKSESQHPYQQSNPGHLVHGQ
jgi:hypothetical protein